MKQARFGLGCAVCTFLLILGGCPGDDIGDAIGDATQDIAIAFLSQVLSLEIVGDGSGLVRASNQESECGDDCSQYDCASACKLGYAYETRVTLTAIPDEGSVFVGWNGGGCEGTGDCAVTMTVSMTVTATFEKLSLARSISFGPK